MTDSVLQKVTNLATKLGVDVANATKAINGLDLNKVSAGGGDVSATTVFFAPLNTVNQSGVVTAQPTVKDVLAYLKTSSETLQSQLTGQIAGLIDDSQTESTTKTYSITKIVSEINTKVSAAITELIDGAPAALNTLKELAAEITAKGGLVEELLTKIGNAVRVDIVQAFTSEQKAQALANIGAVSQSLYDAFVAAVVGDMNAAAAFNPLGDYTTAFTTTMAS